MTGSHLIQFAFMRLWFHITDNTKSKHNYEKENTTFAWIQTTENCVHQLYNLFTYEKRVNRRKTITFKKTKHINMLYKRTNYKGLCGLILGITSFLTLLAFNFFNLFSFLSNCLFSKLVNSFSYTAGVFP